MKASATPSDDFAATVAIPEFHDQIDTLSMFDAGHDEADLSPIDQFIENCKPLNLLWAGQVDPAKHLAHELGILLILGYVSAVEGYMRALIRRVLLCDQFSQKHCESLPLSFGAALHHKLEVLPDALLEESAFSGKAEIVKALTRYLDFTIKNGSDLVRLLDQYESVCQLRHCCVHRFGKLGTKNAIALGGLEKYKACLEKPIRLTAPGMAGIAKLLFVLVKTLNTEVFRHVAGRSATAQASDSGKVGIGWTWAAEHDRPRFAKYYSVFASEKDALASPAVDEMYERFRTTYMKVGKK